MHNRQGWSANYYIQSKLTVPNAITLAPGGINNATIT